MSYARELHDSHSLWIGCWVQVWCVPRSLKDARADLRAAKEYLHQHTYDKWAYSPGRRSGTTRDTHWQQVSPWDTDQARGMVRWSDHYFTDQYLRETRDGGKPLTWHDANGTQDAATWQHCHAEGAEMPVELGSEPTWGRCGHPLGRGRPDKVPQAFCDTFHPNLSESDFPPEYTLDDSGDESDNVVGYDLMNSHYTTVANRDQRERRDQCLVYRRRRRECQRGPNGRLKKLNLPIFRDSTSDNAITYDDWHSEVDNYVREGHSNNLIRDSVLSALEGRPRHTAKAVMEDGDGFFKEHNECFGPSIWWCYYLHHVAK